MYLHVTLSAFPSKLMLLYGFSGGSRIFERGVADLRERYQNIQRQNYLSDSSVPFHNFKLKRPQRGEWLATQSTPPGSAPGFLH